MHDQITIRLPKDLAASLRAAVRRSHRKRSDIVRAALRIYLEPQRWEQGRAYDRIRHLIGAFDTGIPDLAEKHSQYVYESLRRGR
ncbi:MAG: CopG family ribbon-helix-helix protein [Thermoanaerobaculia bacterium]